jgi:glycosyltransferase involved in cell wall biosynthesis
MWLPHTPVPRIGDGRRILHVATRFLSGGSERNIAHSVAWELAAGFSVELAIGRDANVSEIPDAITVHRVSSLKPSVHPRDVVALRQLRRLIGSGAYDIVHSHQSKAGIIGRFAARGAHGRVVHTVHMASFGRGYSSPASLLYGVAERAAAPLADAIVFVGAELRDQYVHAGVVDPHRTLVIRSPIDVEPFLATREWTEEQRRSARRALGLQVSGPLILAVGALEPRKRYDLMIERLAELLHARSAQLAIAGDGPLRNRLRRLAEELGVADHVSLLGQLSNVVPAFAAADLLVHASTTEGVPQVIIQALAAGRSVVATEVTGLSEVDSASVTVVRRDGLALVDGVEEALTSAASCPLPDALDAWTCASVDRGHEELHRRLM